MRTRPGLVLESRYELTSLIATGGMGQVWRGTDQELDRDVAIKVLREEYAFDEGFLKRFRAEARHTAALSHDAIAALYDYGEIDGRAYIVMELCPGRPLSDIIEENPGGLPEKRIISVLIDLARALDAAHSKGVVHRDVKPENVLVDEKNNWSMKITDFGIARSSDQARLTKTGLVMGTAQYLSPEQAMGKQATSLSDIYALGIVAYEMLVGHRPFTGATQVEIAMAQVKQQPPELPEDINPDLRRLVMMALAKAPANRPRSAAAVARILEAIQRGVEPRFTTGAIPLTRVDDHDWTGENPTMASRGAQQPPASAGSPASGGTGPHRAGGSSSSGGSGSADPGRSGRPPRARTAAMPLPLSGRSRGIRHRSGASALSASSASSASSAPSAPSADAAPMRASASPAGGAARSTGAAGSASRATSQPSRREDASRPAGQSAPSAHRTVRGTSTGRRWGGLSVPGIVLIVLLLVVIVAAIAGGMGWLPVPGAAAAGPGVDHIAPWGQGDTQSATTMVRAVGTDLGTRTGVQ